jgi:hypothetical protein
MEKIMEKVIKKRRVIGLEKSIRRDVRIKVRGRRIRSLVVKENKKIIRRF